MKKKVIFVTLVIIGVVLFSIIYKLNFANYDFFVKDQERNYVPIGATGKKSSQSPIIKEFITKTGKIIIVTETHIVGQSLSMVTIRSKGFIVNQSFKLNEIDPIEKIELIDLDGNGFEELYLFTRSVGSGSGGDFYAFTYYKDERLIRCKKEEIEDGEYLEGGMLEGYMGHNTFLFARGMIVMTFPIYKDDDTNSNASAGIGKVFYKLRHSVFEIVK
jgi:hypothetical protein